MSSQGPIKKVRVLVVDDSAYNRQTISGMLQSSQEICVIGKAANGEEAIREVARLNPDVITLDLEMPRMDGFTFLRILMSRRPTPVIVISSHSNRSNVFKALELGALDFIAKPTAHSSPELISIQEELVSKVLLVRQLRVSRIGPQLAKRPLIDQSESRMAPKMKNSCGIVVIGASTGGPPALQALFQEVVWDLPVAYLVAQHMPANFTKAFAERLNRYVGLSVLEASGGELIEPCHVYIAPGGSDLALVRKRNLLSTEIRASLPSSKYVPSINVLFSTAAEAAGERVAALLMTGMGSDGCNGISAVKAAGGLTMAESEETAVIFGMPREAIDTGDVDLVLRKDDFPSQIQRFALELANEKHPE